MGYNTELYGEFTLDRPLEAAHAVYLKKFAEIRHVRRDVTNLLGPDPVRVAAGLPVGPQGDFYIGNHIGDGPGILDYNAPPTGQPGLWCPWVPLADERGDVTLIGWDERVNSYNYVKWLKYLIDNFLRPWGYVLNGKVERESEDSDDCGVIVVQDNRVGTAEYQRVLGEVEWTTPEPS